MVMVEIKINKKTSIIFFFELKIGDWANRTWDLLDLFRRTCHQTKPISVSIILLYINKIIIIVI